jgi:hypothetical protein
MRFLCFLFALMFSGISYGSIDDAIITQVPLVEFLGENKYQPIVLNDSSIGSTQFLILTGSIAKDNQGLYYTQNLDKQTPTSKVKAGKWKHRFTAWQGGRILQIWHRYLDLKPRHDGLINLQGIKANVDLKMIEIPGQHYAEFPHAHRINEPRPLALKLNGIAPFFVVAAVDSEIVSDIAITSYGMDAKTHVYKAETEDFLDPSVGQVMGVIGSFSLIPVHNN